MNETTSKGSTVIKMQKLRRAVGRLRNLRLTSHKSKAQKQSLLAKIKAKLGLTNDETDLDAE